MFQPNHPYFKKDIYDILKVPKVEQRGAWDTGYRKYKDAIYIFSNIGVAGRSGHDYDNHWHNSELVWYAKNKAKIHQPLIQEMLDSNTRVHIFVREDNREAFIYKGIGKAKNHTDSPPIMITWALESAYFIDPTNAWARARLSAKSLLDSGASYYSPKNENEYKIIRVGEKEIDIKRVGAQSKAITALTEYVFNTAITRINGSNGTLVMGSLHREVAIETTIVELIPCLDWDENSDHIEVVGDFFYETNQQRTMPKIKEASNDEEKKRLNAQLRVRRGQNKLRENLFILYSGKCCISGVEIKDTLHACHLIAHAESGNNNSTNALLLRSDIHDLFDANLIGINPDGLKISIKKPLLETEYGEFNGKLLAGRVDNITPDINALNRRWEIFRKV